MVQAFAPLPAEKTRYLRLLLVLATLLFVVGVFAPMLTISQLVLIRSSFSVFSGIVELLRNGHYFLFVLIAGFSLVIPLMKIWVLFRLSWPGAISGPQLRRTLELMHAYGRWAMLDVMVVAILIVTVKLGTIASLQIHYGLYVFGTSVLLIMLITGRIIRLTEAHKRDA